MVAPGMNEDFGEVTRYTRRSIPPISPGYGGMASGSSAGMGDRTPLTDVRGSECGDVEAGRRVDVSESREGIEMLEYPR